MPRIVETIVTTMSPEGEVHIAPLGLIEDGNGWIIAPFKPSRTLDNLRLVPAAVASHTDDVRVFAGCLTGRKEFATRPASHMRGAVLDGALSHWELAVESATEDELRPRFHCRVVYQAQHGAFAGFNRAQGAVIEAAILVSRLGRLTPEKVEAELKYLQIAIDKTAGPREQEAWGWLMQPIADWRRALPMPA